LAIDAYMKIDELTLTKEDCKEIGGDFYRRLNPNAPLQFDEANADGYYNLYKCDIKNLYQEIVMPVLGVSGIAFYWYARVQSFTYDFGIGPVAQVIIPATTLALLVSGDRYVRKHERTWEGEELRIA
jgi:hypothetical protein